MPCAASARSCEWQGMRWSSGRSAAAVSAPVELSLLSRLLDETTRRILSITIVVGVDNIGLEAVVYVVDVGR